MRVYVAAPWVRKADARAAADKLRARGFEVTSHWLDVEERTDDPTGMNRSLERLQQEAKQDIYDVMTAEVLIVLNLEKSEGKAVETGIALAHGKQVFSVGPRSNIFQTLGHEVSSLEEVMDYLLPKP